MTPQIITVLGVLGIAVLLFVTERVRVDVVALLVLVTLALTGLVTPAEALSGFANPAVVTVWAVLILSGGLSRTGIANLIGARMSKLVGTSDLRLVATIMLVTGVLSGFMNDIGVASLFLPVTIAIARRTKKPPSKLLMPLAFASLLGGLVTLIGTPPNIIISEALREAGLIPFSMFDYTPVGVFVLLGGILFMVFLGHKLLPSRDIVQEIHPSSSTDYSELYSLHERMFVLRLSADSSLAGMTLVDCRLGSALGLNVIAILRGDETHLAPNPETVLRAGDRLLVGGSDEHLGQIIGKRHLELAQERLPLENLESAEISLVELELTPNTPLIGSTLMGVEFRQRFGFIVLALRRGSAVWSSNLEHIPLQTGDILLAQGSRDQIEALASSEAWFKVKSTPAGIYNLEKELMMVRLHPGSSLAGKTLVESRFGEAFGMGVLGILRHGGIHLMPAPDDVLLGGDILLVKGHSEHISAVAGLGNLRIEAQPPDIEALETEGVGLVEAVLSPHTTLAGKTLQELNFRTKYGLNVLAIWREGRAYRSNLRDMALRFGDALLLYGSRQKARLLGYEPDFIVMAEGAQEEPRLDKAPAALGIMALVLASVILGWVHIEVAAIGGVVLMVLSGCLTMEEAYRSIQLKAVFLIAGMLPLGVAMQKTGAAQLLAEGMVSIVGDFGPYAVMAGLFILVALASQVMPNPAVAVLLAPIALNTAADLGVSPYPLMMTVAISASAAFLSPVGHSVNVMIMGPGGYRFSDYLKVGLPLTLVVMVVVLLVLPLFWPF